MTETENHRVPAACTLEVREQATRYDRWLRLADRALVSKEATEFGARLVYRADAEPELRELAAAEQDCCAFADWRVNAPTQNLVSLEVSANGENVGVVRAMFELA